MDTHIQFKNTGNGQLFGFGENILILFKIIRFIKNHKNRDKKVVLKLN